MVSGWRQWIKNKNSAHWQENQDNSKRRKSERRRKQEEKEEKINKWKQKKAGE